jgi:hypothetical protein
MYMYYNAAQLLQPLYKITFETAVSETVLRSLMKQRLVIITHFCNTTMVCYKLLCDNNALKQKTRPWPGM